jgi:hypothetical protein
MRPRQLLSSILLFVGALIPFTACHGEECTEADCWSGLTVSAHLYVEKEVLERSMVTFCTNGKCTTGRPAPPGELPSLRSPFAVTEDVSGWNRLDAISALVTGNRGDRFGLKIVTDAGDVLLDVERSVSAYEKQYPNGPECSPTCSVGTMDLYAESATGLTCTVRACQAGFELHQTLHFEADNTEQPEIVLCRNDVCNAEGSEFVYRGSGGLTSYLQGDLRGTVGSSAATDFAREVDLRVFIEGESATLTSGDRYRVLVRSKDGRRAYLNFDEPVSYEAEYLNGAACDVQPCRRAVVDGVP